MTCLRLSLGGSLGFKPRFGSIKAQAFYSLKYRNQRLHSEGLISAGVSGTVHGGSWHLYLTEALGRYVLATEVWRFWYLLVYGARRNWDNPWHAGYINSQALSSGSLRC